MLNTQWQIIITMDMERMWKNPQMNFKQKRTKLMLLSINSIALFVMVNLIRV